MLDGFCKILVGCLLLIDLGFFFFFPHHRNHTTRADAVVDADHALVVGVLPPAQEVLVAEVVGSLIDHETAALHPDRVAAVEVGVKVSTVAHALMMPTLEISVFVEYDLKSKKILISV